MTTFRVLLYALAVLSSLGCCVLLFRGWALKRVRLPLWSALCFAGLTVNNVLLFVDLVRGARRSPPRRRVTGS